MPSFHFLNVSIFCHWTINHTNAYLIYLLHFFFLSKSSLSYFLHIKIGLEWDLALSPLIASKFTMLESLTSQHPLRSAVGLSTLKSQHNLLCSFNLFGENRLRLPTTDTLFPVITPLSLVIPRILALLVLCQVCEVGTCHISSRMSLRC